MQTPLSGFFLLLLLCVPAPCFSAPLAAHPAATNIFIGPDPAWCKIAQPPRSAHAADTEVTFGDASLLVDDAAQFPKGKVTQAQPLHVTDDWTNNRIQAIDRYLISGAQPLLHWLGRLGHVFSRLAARQSDLCSIVPPIHFKIRSARATASSSRVTGSIPRRWR
jgi:hypothetical protein